jgi:hypothetical protein
MHCDMIGPVTANFVLWLVTTGMTHVAFIIDVSPVHFDNFTANPARF